MESFKDWLGMSEQKAYEPHKGGELAAMYDILKSKVQTAASLPSGGTTPPFDAAKVGQAFRLDPMVKKLEKETGATLTPSMLTNMALRYKREWDRQQQTKVPGKPQ